MIAIIGAVLAAAIIVIVLALLVRRQLREKYAIMWLLIAVCVLIVALVPGLLESLTRLVGVQLPSNLFFASAILLLLAVALHLSWELSQAEDEVRRLAEEAAIARTEIDALKVRLDRLEASAGPRAGAESSETE